MPVRIFKRYPLLFRLVTYVLGFSLVIAILLSAARLWFVHVEELDTIRQNLVKLQGSHEDSLTKNLWNMDQEGIDIQLKSILQYPDVTAVALINSYGDTFQSGDIPKVTDDPIINSFSLSKQFKDRSVPLGTVTIYATSVRLQDRLRQHIPLSLVSELMALFLMGTFIVGLFLVKFNRHINKIAMFAESLEISTLDNELHLDRPKSAPGYQDELDRIVSSLNEMRRRLKNGVFVQHQTEQQLLREKVFSDAIINSIPGLFVVYNEELQAILFNDMYWKELGIPKENVSDYRFMGRIVPEDREKLREAIQYVFATQQPVSIEAEMFSQNLGRIPYLMNGSLFKHEGKKYLIGISTDITERKKHEDALRESQKWKLSEPLLVVSPMTLITF